MYTRSLAVMAVMAVMAALASMADFSYKAEMTVSGYSGTTELNSFPVLVRISTNRIEGFRYARCQSDGKDIRFTSPDGATVYPHEIDTWYPDGESLVWVNLPSLSGTATKFLFWFGDAELTTAPDGSGTWRQANGGFYAGVWHFGEEIDAGNAATTLSADSARHSSQWCLDAQPIKGANGNLSVMVSRDGAIGRGRVNCDSSVYLGTGMQCIPYCGIPLGFGISNTFTFSSWYNLGGKALPYYFATCLYAWTIQKQNSVIPNGLEIIGGTSSPSTTHFKPSYVLPDVLNQWFHLTVVFQGTTVTCYSNGVFAASGAIGNSATTCPYATANLGLFLGNNRNAGHYSLWGSYDETRVLSNAASPDWIKASYETATVDGYVSYGAAEKATGSDSLVVTALPEQLAGDAISPSYGVITNEFSNPILMTAPDGDIAVSDTLKIAFVGWELYRMDELGGWQLIDSAVTNAYRYVHEDGQNDKFVWQFVRKRPLSLVATPTGSGSFEISGTSVPEGTVWLPEQSAVTVTAVPSAGYDFLWWGGSHLGVQTASLAIPFGDGTPVSVEAMFLSNGTGHNPVTIGTKGVSGSWMDAATWAQDAAPQYGDTVLVTNGAIVLASPIPRLAKLVVSNATLTVSNWFTRVQADEIQVGPGGVIRTLGGIFDGEMSNRVWLVGNALTVMPGGIISADNAGYACNSGPAWAAVKANSGSIGRESCGIYGGAYTGQPVMNAPSSYGSVAEPSDPGSGCGELSQNVARTRGIGGGAIRLDFSGDVVIHGTVSASVSLGSVSGTGNQYGSGGGVWISCRTIAGSGSVAADGGPTTYTGNTTCGGGGRVAVHYDTAAQDGADCAIAFSARGGMAIDMIAGKTVVPGETLVHNAYSRSGEDCAFVAEAGTIWFPDNRFLSSSTYLSRRLPLSGRWVSPVPLTTLAWTGPVVVSNCFLELPTGMTVTVNGDLSVGGSGYYARRNSGLVFKDSSVRVKGDLNVVGARVELRGGSLTVDGDVSHEATPGTSVPHTASRFRGGELALKAGAADADGCGAVLDIAGAWRIRDRCVVCPFADSVTGAWVKMKANNVVLDEGGRIDADEKGWAVKNGPGVPITYTRGASHAGLGGSNNPATATPAIYGTVMTPIELGSGGGALHNYAGFDGGGLVYLDVADVFALNGIVSADGNTRMTAAYASGSSGGSVYIRARRLTGTTGRIRAQGGCCAASTENVIAYGSTGGGGRIAVWTESNGWTDEMCLNNVTVAPGSENGVPANTFGATAGTVYWKPRGGLQLILR